MAHERYALPLFVPLGVFLALNCHTLLLAILKNASLKQPLNLVPSGLLCELVL